MKVAITGANGYIGGVLTRHCLDQDIEVVACSRTDPAGLIDNGSGQLTIHITCDGIPDPHVIEGCSAIVHLAGRAHNFHAPDADLALFDWSNHQLAVKTAECAIHAGVRRFIQVSTLSVHGNWSESPVDEDSPIQATTPYALSKRSAEVSLAGLCQAAGMELCIVRPPLVYGPACPGNFVRLVRLIQSGLPLPLRSVDARRSFIHVQNLVDFLRHCTDQPQLTDQSVFVIGDGSDWLMPELVRSVARELNTPARLIPFPLSIVRLGGCLLGRSREIDSITRSLLVNWSRARNECHWTPVIDPLQAFSQTMTYFRK
jgi:nucleoside-diphosphate-sugar epimerase